MPPLGKRTRLRELAAKYLKIWKTWHELTSSRQTSCHLAWDGVHTSQPRGRFEGKKPLKTVALIGQDLARTRRYLQRHGKRWWTRSTSCMAISTRLFARCSEICDVCGLIREFVVGIAWNNRWDNAQKISDCSYYFYCCCYYNNRNLYIKIVSVCMYVCVCVCVYVGMLLELLLNYKSDFQK